MLAHAKTDLDLAQDRLVLIVMRHALGFEKLPDVELVAFALLRDHGALEQILPLTLAQDTDRFQHHFRVQVAVNQQS